MENSKRAPGFPGIVSLAYDNRRTPTWKKREQSSVPGPLFDIFVIGTFLVLVIGYFT
jgi:hypothetical protein